MNKLIASMLAVAVYTGLFTNCFAFQSKTLIHEGTRTIEESQPTIISVGEAESAVEELCRRPNIGVTAKHEENQDIEVSSVKYYYFDVFYGLLWGDKPKPEDYVIPRVFISSKDKSIYEVLEGTDNKANIGNKFTKKLAQIEMEDRIEKAIDIVKMKYTSPISDENIYKVKYEGLDEKGRYIISVRRIEDTVAVLFAHVDLVTGEIEEKY